MAQDASVNSDAPTLMEIIGARVARTQVKYHRWARADRQARFGDLFNLVSHTSYLLVAWEHVAHNKGARTAGVDGLTVRQLVQQGGVGAFLAGIAASLKDGTYRPCPVRRVLSWLAALSYSFYLWHQMLAVFLKYDLHLPAWTGTTPPNQLGDTAWMRQAHALYWTAAIAVTLAAYYGVEKPIAKRLHGKKG